MYTEKTLTIEDNKMCETNHPNNIDIRDLKTLEKWMNNVVKTYNEIHYTTDVKVKNHIDQFYLSDNVNKWVYKLLKSNPDTSKLNLGSLSKSLGCIKAHWCYETYPQDVSIEKMDKLLANIPEFKARWASIIKFLDEINSFELNTDNYIKNIIYYIDTHDKIHLHKPNERYGDPFGMLKIVVDETFFVLSHGEQEYMLMKKMPLCLGVHNNRAVFALDEYVIGCSFNLMASKFTVERKRKKSRVECPLTGKEQEVIEELLFKFAHYIETMLIRKDKYPRIIIFEASSDDTLDENISKKIRKLWDDELQGVDIRTNTSLTDSYMTMLGYLFSPISKADRCCMSFYSTASGFGKTSFIKELCKRTDVVFGQLAADSKANQFTFSYAIADGPDILQADDPMKHTDDILNKVSNLVSNHSSLCELKGGAVKMVENLYTKVLITSNIPLYLKSDQNNFLTEKLFELRTNEMQSCSNDLRVSEIAHYIETASDNEINNFLTKCINMYNDNPDWLKQHKGQYIEQDDIECKFSLIDPVKLRNTCNKTLLDCKYDDVWGYDEARHSAYSDVQTQWNIMCKYIKTTWPKLADVCKCSVPRNSGIYSPTSMQPSSRFKNYILNNDLRAKLLEIIKDDDGEVKAQGVVYEELFL